MFITIEWFRPAYKAGGPIQSIANLVQNVPDYEYRIFCSNKDEDGSVLYGVTFDAWTNYSVNTKVWYASKNRAATLKKEVKAIRPHTLFIIGMYSIVFNLVPILFCKAPNKIISARGMLHPGALAQKKAKKKFYLSLLKFFGIKNRFAFHASDEQEKIYTRKIFGEKTKVFVANNFPAMLPVLPSPIKKNGYLQLISIALISPMKNILRVLQAVKNCSQQISYTIYGPVKDEIYWKHCLEEIKKMPGNIVVDYKDDIHPDELPAALATGQVFILPSESENFGHAIYEALSAGKPVITSNSTPWNNLEVAKAGINVALSNTNDITIAINFFAEMDNEEFTKWSRCANEYSQKAIDREEIKRQYHNMFAQLQN
ncbi:MAG TPA: glycosyltransferase [Chitinophagaceae bacterium]|nr:glycosyltransferase [Chitinophagaceae bacterium]